MDHKVVEGARPRDGAISYSERGKGQIQMSAIILLKPTTLQQAAKNGLACRADIVHTATSALQAAGEGGKPEVGQKLLAYGVDPNGMEHTQMVLGG